MASDCNDRDNAVRRTGSGWARAAAILGAPLLCLALTGPPVATGTVASDVAISDTSPMAHRAATHASAGTSTLGRLVEAGGLFVLGASLIGAGRYLRRERGTRQSPLQFVPASRRRPRSPMPGPITFRRQAR